MGSGDPLGIRRLVGAPVFGPAGDEGTRKGAVMQIKDRLGRIGKFLREVRAEMRKVSWPDRKELVSSTVVVVTVVVVASAFIGLIDFLFSQGLALFIR